MTSLYVRLGIAVAILVLGFAGGFKFEARRYAAYRQSVATAAAVQAAKAAQIEKQWQDKLTEAQAINVQNQKWISDHNKPVPSVVCHYPSPGTAPETPAAPAASPPATGELPPKSGGDFDPTDRLAALADQADQVVEACRVLYNSWPQ